MPGYRRVAWFAGACVLLAWAAATLAAEGSAVYPLAATSLRFSHARHTARDCLACHAAIVQSHAPQRLLPDERVCAECHADKTRRAPNDPGEEARCRYCHEDYRGAATGRATLPARGAFPAPALAFSHATHVTKVGRCEGCHTDLDARLAKGERPFPKEAQCLGCHLNGGHQPACTLCHPSLASGIVAPAPGGRAVKPLSGPLDHRDDWTTRHAKEAARDRTVCQSCHAENTCLRCHDGVRKPMSIHPNDYATLHPIDARKDAASCRACHRSQSFCLDCHTKMGVSTEAVTRGRARIHPEGWGSCQPSLTHHSDQAKRQLDACVSCHRESDCLRCHRMGANDCGRDIRIHGHMSSKELSRIKQLNHAACDKCHAK